MILDTDVSQPSQEELERIIDTLREFTRHALFWLEKEDKGLLQHQIVANFIARGTYCLDSIRHLFQIGNYRDCVILHRALTDRLLLLMRLINKSEFTEFQRWSRQRQYDLKHDFLSKPRLRSLLKPSEIESMNARHQQDRLWLKRQPATGWRRPSSKAIAKEMDLQEIYMLSYDYPSQEVHPMSNDGERERQALIRHQPKPDGYDLTTLRTPILVQMILIQTGLSTCKVMWRTSVMDFLHQLVSFMHSGSAEYQITFNELMQLGESIPWCRPIVVADASHCAAEPQDS